MIDWPYFFSTGWMQKCQKTELECSETVEKNLVNRKNFEWVMALWNMYINGQKLVFLE